MEGAPQLPTWGFGGSGQDTEKDMKAIKEEVTRLACAHGLVTPYTSRVGVLLQRDPLDPAKVQHSEVPIQVRLLLICLSSLGGTHVRHACLHIPTSLEMAFNGLRPGAASAIKMPAWPAEVIASQ